MVTSAKGRRRKVERPVAEALRRLERDGGALVARARKSAAQAEKSLMHLERRTERALRRGIKRLRVVTRADFERLRPASRTDVQRLERRVAALERRLAALPAGAGGRAERSLASPALRVS